MAKSENHQSRCRGSQSDDWVTRCGWRWNDEKVWRSKLGDLNVEVTTVRSQSPHSSAGNSLLPESVESKPMLSEGG